MQQTKTLNQKFFLLLLGLCFGLNAQAAGLAVTPGVTTTMLDQIDEIPDESLREMLKAAVWPRFGETFMNLDRAEEDLTPFERNYKTYPLTLEQKVENVRYLLEQAEDPAQLTTDNLEYMDIEFGEAVIPVTDKRVTEILNTDYLIDQASQIEAERQAALSDFYENGGDGKTLQQIEDEYAAKLASLIEAENKFKESKIDFLKLKNKQKFGRITDEEFNQETLTIVESFEDFARLGGKTPVFSEDDIKQIGNQIYNPTTQQTPTTSTETSAPVVKEKFWYWGIAVIFMLIALALGYLGFRRLKK